MSDPQSPNPTSEREQDTRERRSGAAEVSSYHNDAELRSPVVYRILERLERRRRSTSQR